MSNRLPHYASVFLAFLSVFVLGELFSQNPVNQNQTASHDVLVVNLDKSTRLEMVRIPSGEFDMGSSENDDDEKPVHHVQITKEFYMGATEVTQAQWLAVMGKQPTHFTGQDFPVEHVSWENAKKFCEELSKKDGKPYRFPTEAEWEYACRAGTKTRFSFGDQDADLKERGWHKDNSGKRSQKAGSLKPNAWGLYDMHGNMWEWCGDLYSEYRKESATDPTGPDKGVNRVMRGGSWYEGSQHCSSANRFWDTPTSRYDAYGFRVARDLE